MRALGLSLVLLALWPSICFADEPSEFVTHVPTNAPAESFVFPSRFADGVVVEIGAPRKGLRRVELSNCGRASHATWKYDIRDWGGIYSVLESGDGRQSETFCELAFAIRFASDPMRGYEVAVMLFPNGQIGVTEPELGLAATAPSQSVR